MKDKILRVLAVLNGISLFISFGYIEQYLWIPFIICVLNGAYLAWYGYITGVIE